jgi:hypothetical protein
MLVVAFFLAAPPVLSAQIQPVPPVPSEEKSTVVVKGCVSYNRLKHADTVSHDVPAEILQATEYVLEGPKELLRQLGREHDGHFDEITGVVRRPPTPGGTTGDVRSKKLGKGGTVTLGARREESELPPLPVRMRVVSLRHISEHCEAR